MTDRVAESQDSRTDFSAAQATFHERHGSSLGGSPELADWVAQVLGGKAEVRHYATSDASPSKQLKNKLAQAASAGPGVLVLLSLSGTAYEKGLKALVDGWHRNGWAREAPCVALVGPAPDGSWAIRDLVISRPTTLPDSIQNLLFPEARLWHAVGFQFPATSIEELAENLYVPAKWLASVEAQLRNKKALVFYGPPGTGKTFIARQLAAYMQPDRTLRPLIQLHPSYTYEHFFEGYRPVPGDGGLQLEKRRGPLKRLCDEMGDRVGVLILDEMNRANLAAVFGELYYLLEYRDQDDGVELMYAEQADDARSNEVERFRLPEELHFIGTMNTADRSVAPIDQALRRRFRFVPLFPNQPPLAPNKETGHQGVLREFLADRRELGWLPAILDKVNERLGDPDGAIGPSHFLREDLSDAAIEDEWKHTILPMVRERVRGRTDLSLDDFDLASLKKIVGAIDDDA